MRKFYKTTFTVEVLSEEPFNETHDLSYIGESITLGECSGTVSISEDEELSAEQMAEALIEQGSDPDFFMDLPQIIEELEKVR